MQNPRCCKCGDEMHADRAYTHCHTCRALLGFISLSVVSGAALAAVGYRSNLAAQRAEPEPFVPKCVNEWYDVAIPPKPVCRRFSPGCPCQTCRMEKEYNRTQCRLLSAA